MIDIYDEAALYLREMYCAHTEHRFTEDERCAECVEDLMTRDISDLMRKAAAAEREAIAVTLDGWAARHGPACDCEASVVVAGLAGGIRARAKGGA